MDDLDLGQTIRGFVAGQKLFRRFSLIRILGKGGMGVVWLARDEDLSRNVALKFLPDLIIHDKAVLDDLKRETTRSLDLTHHNIVRIYDFAHDSQSACISMEYVDGETLSALRVERPNKVFEVEELAPIMMELCEALTYAHTRAFIVHRDLKPANLMLNSRKVLKVTDFGIARSLSDSVSMLTRSSGTSGTLLYMSPQQLDGERTTTLDDIYSVGATIYELLTSKPPFYTGSIERQIHMKTPVRMSVRREDLGNASTTLIPEHWEETVAACLAKNPADRPQTVAELADRLRGLPPPAPAAVVPAPIAVPPVPFVTAENEPSPGRSRSSKLLLYLGGALLLLVAIGLVLFLRSMPKKEATPRAAQPTAAPVATVSPTTTAIAIASPRATAQQTVSITPASTIAERASSDQASAGYDPAIAVVDMNRIFKEYNKTKSAETKINAEKDEAKKDYDQRAATYKKALDDLNGLTRQLDQPSLSAEARAAKAKERDNKIAEIKKLEREINDFRTQREKELQARAMEMRDSIVAEMTAAIKRLGGAVNLVLDKSGTSSSGVPFLIFSPTRTDMSDRVIAALNRSSSSPDSSFDATQGLRFAVIDMNRAFKEYNKTKQSEGKLNEARDVARKEYDDRAEHYKKAVDEINQLNKRIDATRSGSDTTKLSKERDDKIATLKNMEREINDFRQTREKQLQEQMKRMLDGLVREITDVVAERVKANSGDFVLDTSNIGTGGAPIILFSKGITDLTDSVVVTMNGAHTSAGSSESWTTTRKLRFAAVDLNRAFKEWPETKSEEAKLNAARAAAKKEYDARSETYKKALDELNELNRRLDSPNLTAAAKTATAKARDDRAASLKILEKETNDYRQAREKELTDQATKMREAIVATIRGAINSCAERENFNIVFDSSGTSLSGVPLLVLTHNLPDITDKVLKR